MGTKTKSHILEHMAWSFRMATAGVRPQQDLLGHPMHKSRRPGDALQSRFLLMEVRGDWPALSSALGVPAFKRATGMCWRQPQQLIAMCTARYEEGSIKQGVLEHQLKKHATHPGITPDGGDHP
eukprot:6359982-Amphidinium_carterae.1